MNGFQLKVIYVYKCINAHKLPHLICLVLIQPPPPSLVSESHFLVDLPPPSSQKVILSAKWPLQCQMSVRKPPIVNK